MSGKVHIEATADVQKWMQATAKQVSKQEELLAKLRATVNESKRADEATVKWSSSMDAVTRHVAGFVSIGAAIGAATSAMRRFDELAKSSAASLESTQEAFKRLMQISGGSANRFADLVARSKSLSAAEGLDLPTAADTTFAFESNLLSPADQKTLTAMSRFVSPAGLKQMAASLANQRRIFGAAAVGSAEQFANRVIVAAEPSRADIESLALASSIPALSSSGVNASPSLSMAMTSVLSQGAPSPEEGATMVGRMQDRFREVPLLRKIALSAPKGMGPLAVADYLSGLSDVQQDRLIGAEVRGWRGWQLFKQPESRELIRNTVERMDAAAAQAGTENSLLRRTGRIVEGSPELSAVRARQIGQSRDILAGTRLGTEEEVQQAMFAETRASLKKLQGRGVIGKFGLGVSESMIGLTDVINGSLENIRRDLVQMTAPILYSGAPRHQDVRDELAKKLDELIAAFRENGRAVETAATRGGGSAARDAVDRGGE